VFVLMLVIAGVESSVGRGAMCTRGEACSLTPLLIAEALRR
jgi:hypothetical protein